MYIDKTEVVHEFLRLNLALERSLCILGLFASTLPQRCPFFRLLAKVDNRAENGDKNDGGGGNASGNLRHVARATRDVNSAVRRGERHHAVGHGRVEFLPLSAGSARRRIDVDGAGEFRRALRRNVDLVRAIRTR